MRLPADELMHTAGFQSVQCFSMHSHSRRVARDAFWFAHSVSTASDAARRRSRRTRPDLVRSRVSTNAATWVCENGLR
jgi:hypothetical protein